MVDFTTQRLNVRSWRPLLSDTAARQQLETKLLAMLTTRVLEHLPPSLQLGPGRHGIARWTTDRASESEVLLVESKDSGSLLGLLLLGHSPSPGKPRSIHIGYLLAENAWGLGFASEMVIGLVRALADHGPLQLSGGVSEDNPASARVLQKAGFTRQDGVSAAGMSLYLRDIN